MNYSRIDPIPFCYPSKWRADNVLSRHFLPETLRPWIISKGSLTAALTNLSDGNFSVNVLSQNISIPKWHEQRVLNQSLTCAAMIRQVELKIHDEPVVFARSIIPLALVLKGRKGLANLARHRLDMFSLKTVLCVCQNESLLNIKRTV